MRPRMTSRLAAQKSTDVMSMSKRAASSAAVARPVDDSRSSYPARNSVRVLLVPGVQADAEQQAETVGPVVKRGRVVVGLHRPHVRVQSASDRRPSPYVVPLGVGHELDTARPTGRTPFSLLADTSRSKRNRLWMSTTTWQAPCRSTLSRARRWSSSAAGQAGLDHDRLAEDARRLGQGHRRPALQRGAPGQVGVVVGVAELVGQGLHAVEGPVEVEQDPRLVAAHRHAEGAAPLALPGLGVDPPLGQGPVGQRRPAGAEYDPKASLDRGGRGSTS